MDILHRGPNNREATGFGCKGINLIGTLANIALQNSQWHWYCE